MTGLSTLVLGWGNPGRGDDGIGPAIIDALAAAKPLRVDLSVDYQLQVEHAAEVSRYDRVVFVDAMRGATCPFRLSRLEAGTRPAAFSSHALRPEAVLALARVLFGAAPEAWLLAVRGSSFELGTQLSGRGRRDADRAALYLRRALRGDRLVAFAADATEIDSTEESFGNLQEAVR